MPLEWMRWRGPDVILFIVTQPNASKDVIAGPVATEFGSRLKIKITAPPMDGKANAHLIKFLAKRLSIPKSHITLEAGESGRHKRIRIHGLEPECELLKQFS